MGRGAGRRKFESKAERQARRAEEERARAPVPDVPRAALVSRIRERTPEPPSAPGVSARERKDDE